MALALCAARRLAGRGGSCGARSFSVLQHQAQPSTNACSAVTVAAFAPAVVQLWRDKPTVALHHQSFQRHSLCTKTHTDVAGKQDCDSEEAGTQQQQATSAAASRQDAQAAQDTQTQAAAQASASPAGAPHICQNSQDETPGSPGDVQSGPASATTSMTKATTQQKQGQQRKGTGQTVVVNATLEEKTVFAPIVQGLRWVMGRVSAIFIRNQIDTKFNEDEFLQGAMDAYWMVNQLFAGAEWDVLKPMISDRLMQAYRETHKAFADQGLTISSMEIDVQSASIEGVSVLTREHMQRLMIVQQESSASAENLGEISTAPSGQQTHEVAASGAKDGSATASTSSTDTAGDQNQSDERWLEVQVRFQGRLLTKMTDAAGNLANAIEDRRSQCWRFVRGPLALKQLPASAGNELPGNWVVAFI